AGLEQEAADLLGQGRRSAAPPQTLQGHHQRSSFNPKPLDLVTQLFQLSDDALPLVALNLDAPVLSLSAGSPPPPGARRRPGLLLFFHTFLIFLSFPDVTTCPCWFRTAVRLQQSAESRPTKLEEERR